MVSRIVFLLAFIFTGVFTQAQYLLPPLKNDLRGIPEVKVTIYDSALLKQDFKLAFTTMDRRMMMEKSVLDPTSFQIVSATHPFPPEVFAFCSASQIHNGKVYLFQDFRIHANGKSSMYVNLHDSTTRIDAYFIMQKDTQGKFKVIDTFGSNESRSVDAHSFVVDKKGRYWFVGYNLHKYDMSHRTKNIDDTTADIQTTKVEVWDPAVGKYVFEMDLWERGLIKIDSIPMHIIEMDSEHHAYDVTHANSWVPMGEVDGCDVGLLSDLMDGVKFIRLCDSTVLRYGATLSDFKSLDSSDYHLHLQHDFRMISDGPYKGYFSCFDDGSSPTFVYRYATVPILKFDLKRKTVQKVKEYSFPAIYSTGRGNVDFMGDYMLINFGVEKVKFDGVKNDPHYTDTLPNWVMWNIVTNKMAAKYYLPVADHSYNVWFMKGDQTTRPQISFRNNKLSIDPAKWSNPMWSTGESTYSITPIKKGPYYVTVNGGGLFRQVSDEIKFPEIIAKGQRIPTK